MFRKMIIAAIAMMFSYLASAQYQQDLFQQGRTDRSEYMSYSSGHLYLGGRMIDDEYAWEYIGHDLYESTYSGARKQYRAGKVLTIVGGCLSGLGLGVMIAGAAGDDSYALSAGAVTFFLAQPVLGGGIAFMCIGKGRLGWIAEDYNHNSRSRQPNLSFGATRSGIGLALNF